MSPYSPRVFLGIALVLSLFLSPDSGALAGTDSDPGGEVLTKGPVHEAFANAVVYNPEPGPLVTKVPPSPIEELPAEVKPEGTNVVWIPGYWAWDDERDDYIWISGLWRDLPPGRVWVPGYWITSDEGARWVTGYWGDAGRPKTQAEYIAEAPPPSLEVGPNTPAPSDEAIWVSGFWVWQSTRYIWSPGCWHTVRPDYVWVPASYIWSPHGFIFVGGYWDYVVARRGVIYAPVYFRAGYPFYPGWHYRPRSIISISVFDGPIFYRPHYAHYYFGDYYAPTYNNVGFQISFSFHSHGGGYDPLYARQSWENRHNPGWDSHNRSAYEQRRTEAAARPAPVFLANQQNPRGDRNKPVQTGANWQPNTGQTSNKSNNGMNGSNPYNRPGRNDTAKKDDSPSPRREGRNPDNSTTRTDSRTTSSRLPETPSNTNPVSTLPSPEKPSDGAIPTTTTSLPASPSTGRPSHRDSDNKPSDSSQTDKRTQGNLPWNTPSSTSPNPSRGYTPDTRSWKPVSPASNRTNPAGSTTTTTTVTPSTPNSNPSYPGNRRETKTEFTPQETRTGSDTPRTVTPRITTNQTPVQTCLLYTSPSPRD